MIHKIISHKKNPSLEREEFVLEIENRVTPSYAEVEKIIGKNNELTVVKNVSANFGRYKFMAEAVVYDNVEAKNKIEVVPRKIKKKIEEERKKKEEEEKKSENKTEEESPSQ